MSAMEMPVIIDGDPTGGDWTTSAESSSSIDGDLSDDVAHTPSPTQLKRAKGRQLVQGLQEAMTARKVPTGKLPLVNGRPNALTVDTSNATACAVSSPASTGSGGGNLSAKALQLLQQEESMPEGWSRARMYVHKRFPPNDHKNHEAAVRHRHAR